MILLLNTSGPTCYAVLVENEQQFAYQWDVGRELARDLLRLLRDALAEHNLTFADITGIGVMKGPGSFTGLRIGLTVMNTLASDRNIPIVGVEDGAEWQNEALARLQNSENDQLVMPHYGREANITKPRK